MDSIVVDTKQTASECIKYLREQRIGVCTFIPLDHVQVPTTESTERLREEISGSDSFRMAVDVISCEDSMKRAVQYAVGNTVLCDDLDSARVLCFGSGQTGHQLRHQQSQGSRIKAVTLGGAVISKAGTMTGGVSSEDSSKAGRWNDQEMSKLREKKEKLEAERAELESGGVAGDSRRRGRGSLGHATRIEELKNNLGSLKNREQFSKVELDFSSKQLKEKETLLKSTQKSVSRLEQQVASAEKEFNKANEAVEKALAAVKAVEDEHFGPFREKTGLRDLKAYEEAVGKSRDEFNEKKRTIMEHIAQLEQQKEYEIGRDLKAPIARIEKRIQERETALAKSEKEQATIETKLSNAKDKLAEAEENMKAATEKEKSLEEDVQNAQKDFTDAQTERLRISKKLSTVEAELERLRGKLHETLQKAQVEEVELPFVGQANSERSRRSRRRSGQSEDQESGDEDEESQPSSTQLTASEAGTASQAYTQDSRSRTHFSQADNPIVLRDQNKADKVDFSTMRASLKQRLSDREEKKMRKEFEDKLAKIQGDIESITPNMKVSFHLNTPFGSFSRLV